MDVRALYKISYGLYTVSSAKDDVLAAQIANSVFQVTSDPVRIAVCLNKQNATHEAVADSGVFAVSVLEKDTPLKFIGVFGFKSSRDVNKFEGVKYRVGKTGAPIVLDHTVAYVEAEVVKSCDIGTHTLFIGNVVEAELLKDAEVLTYDYYQAVKRGKAPRTATVYFE